MENKNKINKYQVEAITLLYKILITNGYKHKQACEAVKELIEDVLNYEEKEEEKK